MPIDPSNERVFSLNQAPKLYPFPIRRGGKRVNVSTLYRWSQDGCRGVRLETVQIGGTRCTSREALARFFQRLTQGPDADQAAPRSPLSRQRAVERAIQALEQEGA